MPCRTSIIKLFTFVFVASLIFGTVGPVHAIWEGAPGGRWPKSWPRELEPLRKQAWSWSHDGVITRYDISFRNRKEFESAWPHLVKLKSKGAPVTLLRGPHVQVWTTRPPRGQTAGVRIFCSSPINPPDPKAVRLLPADSKELGVGIPPSPVTGIELVVDGDIVDLNRIRLPADTPIVDRRFPD